MENIATKSTGDSLTAGEWNQIPDEMENLITSMGIALSGADLTQISKAIAGYAAQGDFYTDSGDADAYALSPVGSQKAPTAYVTGMRGRFVVGNTNTGASTANVATLGVKNIKMSDGADPAAGDLVAGYMVEWFYDGTNIVVQLAEDIPARKSFAISGYIKLTGGLIVQWGNATFSVAGNAVSFPITYPNAHLRTITCSIATTAHPANAASASTTGFTGYSDATVSCAYISIGY